MTRAAAVLLILIAAAMVPPLGATTLIPADFRQIVSEATLIVRGRISDVRAVTVRDTGVESVGTIAIESVIKGPATEFVAVRVPGGRVGRYRYTMVGAPELRVGERAVFFLKQGPDAAWRLVGFTQGMYRVQPEPQTGRAVVQPPIVPGRTAPIVGRVTRGDVRRRLMPVSEFESLVRLVMASPPGQAVPRGGRQ